MVGVGSLGSVQWFISILVKLKRECFEQLRTLSQSISSPRLEGIQWALTQGDNLFE